MACIACLWKETLQLPDFTRIPWLSLTPWRRIHSKKCVQWAPSCNSKLLTTLWRDLAFICWSKLKSVFYRLPFLLSFFHFRTALLRSKGPILSEIQAKIWPIFSKFYILLFIPWSPQLSKANVFLISRRRALLCTHLDADSAKGVLFKAELHDQPAPSGTWSSKGLTKFRNHNVQVVLNLTERTMS